jgi:hypothetical protein
MLITAWGLAVLLSLPQTFIFHLDRHPDYPWYEQCVTFGTFNSRLYEFLYFFMGMIFLYILPFVVIIVTYGGIIIHLHKKSGGPCIKKSSKHINQVDIGLRNWPSQQDPDDEGKNINYLLHVTQLMIYAFNR